MAVHRTHKLLSSEKRLQLLQAQLYGKMGEVSSIKYQASSKEGLKQETLNTNYVIPNTDTTYLKHDLTKIALLTTPAIGIQLLIYFGSRSNLLRLF